MLRSRRSTKIELLEERLALSVTPLFEDSGQQLGTNSMGVPLTVTWTAIRPRCFCLVFERGASGRRVATISYVCGLMTDRETSAKAGAIR